MTSSKSTQARWTLGDLFYRFGRSAYDWMYRRGAPWEGSTKHDFIELLSSGQLSPDTVGTRAIDIGCGVGDYSRLLARYGFEVSGIDLSPVAIERARENTPDDGNPRFLVADLLDLPDELDGPFDLLIDIGTLDDFPRRKRPLAVEVISSLARRGSTLYLWCFFGPDEQLPAVSFDGASRYLAPGIEPDELEALFGIAWDIDSVADGDRWASFLMTRC